MKLCAEEARALVLRSQGLDEPVFSTGAGGALSAIEHLSYLQIDTLAVVARAHHHTMWSRVEDYRENHLDDLLEQKKIFEYWSHAASFLPMRDYRFSLPRKKLFAEGKSHWFAQDKKLKQYVYDRIKAEGPLQSKDFEHRKRKPGLPAGASAEAGMWNWKPSKRALEQLFQEGKLMVARRQGFQKVYDLAERVLPEGMDTTMPSKEEFAEYLVLSAVRSQGLVTQKEIAYLRKGQDTEVGKALRRLCDAKKILPVKAEGREEVYFALPSAIKKIKPVRKDAVHILSPFDNSVIQRKRLLSFFNFDFMIECYLPEKKRRFGYFCLPVLYGDRFVARFDPKADRQSKVFHVKNFHLEEGFVPDEDFAEVFTARLEVFARFNGCDRVKISGADKRTGNLLKAQLKKL
jgi:uncharacterized protein